MAKKVPSLRNRAESTLSSNPPDVTTDLPAHKLLHELQVHRIELEMQNESLRESQLALEESRDRYADLYEFAPVGFITLTADGVIEEINLSGAAALGLERAKLKGRRFASFIAPADRDGWHRLFLHTLKHDGHKGCDLIFQRADGSSMHAQLSGMHPTRIGDKTVLRFAFMDISEQDQAHANERRMRRILDSTLDMIFIYSSDKMRFEYVNMGAVRSIGYSREELLQMSPLDILTQSSEEEYHAFVTPLTNGTQETLRFETALICKDGKSLPVEIRLQLVRENDNNGMYVAIVRDITDQKQAERDLRQQKNLMWQVIDTDPNVIFVKDETGKFILANQAIADYYGVSIPEMIGKSDAELNRHPEEVERFNATDSEVIESKRDINLTEMLTRDGKQFWYYTVKRPLPQADGSVHVLGIAVDITGLKQSENKLTESYRELQRLSLHLENVRSEERAQIGRNLHDEMGAVLAALKMRVAWLSGKLPGEMPHLEAEADNLSELVSEGIRTLRQVVSDLRPNLLHDIGLIDAIRDYAKRFERNTEIRCTTDLPVVALPLNDEQSVIVFRIVQESLNNIAKHARARRVEISLGFQPHELQLKVRDDGVGFDTMQDRRTFGLLGIKERARMIGGTASVESRSGSGTVVTLSIPLPHNGQGELDYSVAKP